MATVFCPSCGKEYDESTQFCPQDGTTLHSTANRRSGAKTPGGGIGTLVGTRATSEQDAQKIKEALARDAAGLGRPGNVPKPTDPLSRPSIHEKPERSMLGIAITVGVVLVIVVLIAVAMRR